MTALGLPVPPGFVVCSSAFGGASVDGERAARARPRAATTPARRRSSPRLDRPRPRSTSLRGARRRRPSRCARAPSPRTPRRRASPASRRRTWTSATRGRRARARRRLLGVVLQRARALLPRAQGLARRPADGGRGPADGRAADVAGVLFTVDPVARRRDQMVVEAVFGLGEPAVSGELTPDNYTIARDGSVKSGASSRSRGRSSARGGRAVAGGRRARDAPDDQLAALASSAATLEEHNGGPRTSSGRSPAASCTCCSRAR